MALKTVLDTLDGLDEAVKALYSDANGKFVLQVEGLNEHPEVVNLKTAHERQKQDNAKLKADLDAAKKAADEMAKGKPDEAKLVEERKALEAEIAKWKGEAEAANGRYLGVSRDRALDDALSGVGIKEPAFMKAARALLTPLVKMDGDKPVIETDMGPKALGDFAKSWAAGEGKAFVTPPSGGGAKGNDGKVSGKSMTRADFDKLDPQAKVQAMTVDKVTLTD